MTAYADFDTLRLSAVQAFVRTAILIDNEPRTDVKPNAPEVPKKATSAAAPNFGAAPTKPQPAKAAGGASGEPAKAAPSAKQSWSLMHCWPSTSSSTEQLAKRPAMLKGRNGRIIVAPKSAGGV